MAPRHCDTPCFVSPRPDVLAKAKQQVLKSKNNATTAGIEKAKKFLASERKMPGLNDGTIFPKSHFGDSASVMAMSTAALDRAPLRSIIRYVCRLQTRCYVLTTSRVIIVLVEFQDVKMAPGTKQRMEDLWFSTERKVPTGSVTEYYSEVSNNAISLAGEVVGPFTLSKDMGYYANGSMLGATQLIIVMVADLR